jgi:hypothetical protein
MEGNTDCQIADCVQQISVIANNRVVSTVASARPTYSDSDNQNTVAYYIGNINSSVAGPTISNYLVKRHITALSVHIIPSKKGMSENGAKVLIKLEDKSKLLNCHGEYM